jgi:hypothetical protein
MFIFQVVMRMLIDIALFSLLISNIFGVNSTKFCFLNDFVYCLSVVLTCMYEILP